MKNIRWVAFLIFFLTAASCGYRFTGGGDFPFGIKKIYVSIFENRAGGTGIENIITNDFIYEFTRSNKVKVVGKNKADAVFSGTIVRIATEGVSRANRNSPLERRVKLTLDLKLTDREGKVLWMTRGLSEDETYTVFSEKLSTEREQRKAISELSQRLAQIVYNRLTDIEDTY